MSFKDLNLQEELLRTIEQKGYKTPTPIQKLAIPKILEGKDVLACAHTGTGKTAAFLLPALKKMLDEPTCKGNGPRVLILVPTRELAEQVAKDSINYSRNLLKIKTVCIYGGVPYPIQKRELSKKYEILVATPGRLIDHIERGKIKFSRLEMLVLDEADRMLDMGFIQDVEKIASFTPKEHQTLLFSATLSKSILKLAENLLNDPISIQPESGSMKPKNIKHQIYKVDDLSHKHRILEKLLEQTEANQAIIFTSTKAYADTLEDDLKEKGYNASALHGDMKQFKRTKILQKFHAKKLQFLVATDVAARGLNIPNVSFVINFDLPRTKEDYIHRIGRTGRANAHGIAISLAANKENEFVKKIEEFSGQKIDVLTIEGLEPRKQTFIKAKKNFRNRFDKNQKSFKRKKPARKAY
ncbi:MAG: DEAD/DEAH box helicase [Parachlamydiales bacterium]|nr:DEAD/DEAH box helicase [Parachlamydiales bacterium]